MFAIANVSTESALVDDSIRLRHGLCWLDALSQRQTGGDLSGLLTHRGFYLTGHLLGTIDLLAHVIGCQFGLTQMCTA